MKRALVLLAFVAASFVCQAQREILVAAASDLKFALDSIIHVYEQENSVTVKATYGSSGKLCEQIINGAPFHVFFSADISYPEQLKTKGLTSSEIYTYARGTIVLWSKKIDTKKGMSILSDKSIRKIAIGNPAHAPYGKRAMEAIEYYKLTSEVKPKLVMGENISQAAQFVTTGAADIGIIALSIAVSPNMLKEKGNYTIIPAGSHQPLIQGAVVTKAGSSSTDATAFLNFIKSEKAVLVLKHFGF